MLTIEDFDAFFHDVHGVSPFPWQRRLLQSVAESGRWPELLDLPTGSGKTAALDIAVFHLALEVARGEERRAPVRIAFVVDRRLVVDDAFRRAEEIAFALENPRHRSVELVAAELSKLAGDGGPPLAVQRLRGGIPREDDWARTPAQPTILCSTVDQVGSRLLFRGYGVSDSMKPIHAGLLGADCLILLDEAHLAQPFQETLSWVETYRGPRWREEDGSSPWGVTTLTATAGAPTATEPFRLDAEDLAHEILGKRLRAKKPASLVLVSRGRKQSSPSDGSAAAERDLPDRTYAIIEELEAALKHFADNTNGVPQPAIGIVVNRVARARSVFEKLKEDYDDLDVELLIGPARAVDREEVVSALESIRTSAAGDGKRMLERPLILVATQTIEVGVDIDLDGLITEAASLDALRQRFGRLNRGGRPLVPYASIIAWRSDISGRYEDPVYGKAIGAAWARLDAAATRVGRRKMVDFGIHDFNIDLDPEALSPRASAPVLLPAHLDLLAQTSPVPAADPEVSFFLHGVKRDPDAVTVVWRGDLLAEASSDPTPPRSGSNGRSTTRPGKRHPAENIVRLLTLVPPRAAESIQLPVWVVRRWLRNSRDLALNELADTATIPSGSSEGEYISWREVFRWRGDDERSEWIAASQIRPGDTIVVPTEYGGVDRYGWNPGVREGVVDVAAEAARPYAGRSFVVRVAPGLLGKESDVSGDDGRSTAAGEEQDTAARSGPSAAALADCLATAASQRWRDLRDALLDLDLPTSVREDLERLDYARKGKVIAYTDIYPSDSEGRASGVIFVAPLGLIEESEARRWDERENIALATTEDDLVGSLPGFQVRLDLHSEAVARLAEEFGTAAGLSADRIVDLRVAGLLHDLGKVDPRFQAWLHYGDPLGPDPTETTSVLAKSGRTLPKRARQASGLPARWRHEALSVRLAPLTPAFAEARDPELVLWLIGSHHGHGRVLFPHQDPEDASSRDLPKIMGLPEELPAGPGPQSIAFDWNGMDWPTLHERVRARYGIWELARMEAILRLADHRASEREARREEER